jgi:hypothetical protein
MLVGMGIGALQSFRSLRRGERRHTVTRKPDGIPWDIKPVPSRLISVGDVHGDIAGLSCILAHCGLIDGKGRWSGGDAHLILIGDLVGGKHTRLVLRFVMRLQREADAEGGAVHPLLGNRDIRFLYSGRLVDAVHRRSKGNGASKERGKTVRDMLGENSVLGGWAREQNAIIKIGPNIFTHAGLNAWASRHDPARINSTIRAWIRYWQGISAAPDPRTQWVVLGPAAEWPTASTGPLWTRSYRISKESEPRRGSAPSREELSRILKKYRALRMIIGHAPVDNGKILLSHPCYGPMVVMIDTSISRKKNGSLGYLEINGNHIQSRYVKRNQRGEKITGIERKRSKKSRMRSRESLPA